MKLSNSTYKESIYKESTYKDSTYKDSTYKHSNKDSTYKHSNKESIYKELKCHDNICTKKNITRYCENGKCTEKRCEDGKCIQGGSGRKNSLYEQILNNLGDKYNGLKCPFCSKFKKNTNEMDKHLLKNHGEQDINCIVCEKIFKIKDITKHLKEHKQSGSGNGKWSKQKGGYNGDQELKKIILGNKKRKYYCPICYKHTQNSMLYHMLDRHLGNAQEMKAKGDYIPPAHSMHQMPILKLNKGEDITVLHVVESESGPGWGIAIKNSNEVGWVPTAILSQTGGKDKSKECSNCPVCKIKLTKQKGGCPLPFCLIGLGDKKIGGAQYYGHKSKIGGAQYYGHKSAIMVKVPENVKKAALNAYKLKKLGFKGGLETGWKRAKQLSTKSEIPIEDLKYMKAWYARHVYASYPSYKKWKNAGYPNTSEWHNKHGIISWLIWGGTPAFNWVNSQKNITLLNKHYNKTYKPIKLK